MAADGTRSEIAAGALISPGGMALGRDGSIYVSRFATLPGAGDVVRIRNRPGGCVRGGACIGFRPGLGDDQTGGRMSP